MSELSSSLHEATGDPREEGEELSSSPTPHQPQSPSSPTQQKRRRYDDETDTTRRDRTDRPDELNQPDRRPSPSTMEDDQHPTDPSLTSSDEKETELRLLLESNHVGAIIGKGGEVIKRLRDEYQCYLNILKVSDQTQGGPRERVMVIKGGNDAVLRTLSQIIDLQVDSQHNRERREHGDDAPLKDQTQIKLLVHRTTVGAVIGREGATIRQTSQSTGARVQVSGDALPHSSEKTVAISGTKEQVNAALSLVVEQIKSNPPKPGTKVMPYVPGVYGGGGYQGGGGYGQGGYQPQPPQFGGYQQPPPFGGAEGPMTEQKIAIPSVCAGCVIGKGGQIIRDLRTQSNCLINVEKPDPAVPMERVVTIKGTNHAIQTAVYLIRQCVEQYKPREDGGRGDEY